MVTRPGHKLKAFLSPSGAGIVLICFFLPWVRVSCGSKTMIISGHSLGGVFWLVLGAAILTLISFAYFHRRQKIKNAAPFMLASAAVALGTIIYKYILVIRNPEIPFYVPASAINIDVKLGAVGTLLGLLMIAVGSIILGPPGAKNIKQTMQIRGPIEKERTFE